MIDPAPPRTPHARDEVLAALDRVAPTIEASAAQADLDGRFPAEVMRSIMRAGPYRLWIPRAYGGDELPLPDSLEVFERAASIDGAAGWLVTIGVGGGLFAAQLDEQTAREIYGPPDALIAGSGMPTGTATPVDGGYRVDGRWRYASGAHHATWFTANCVVEDGSAEPAVRAMAFPAAAVEVLDTWRVSGMRATGSHDFVVRDAFVPERRSFDVFGAPREGGPLYRFPFMSIAELSFAAVALGIARHALSAFDAEVALAKRERDDVRALRREGEATLDAVRARFLEQATAAWETVCAVRPVEDAQRAAVRLAAVEATRTAATLVEQLYLAGGMVPLFLDSELGRCWRDIHAVTQHTALSPA